MKDWLKAVWSLLPLQHRWMFVPLLAVAGLMTVVVVDRCFDKVTTSQYRLKVTTEKSTFELAPAEAPKQLPQMTK